jgi:hypothetical protein
MYSAEDCTTYYDGKATHPHRVAELEESEDGDSDTNEGGVVMILDQSNLQITREPDQSNDNFNA